jgi:hypothetical protein
MSAVSTKLKLSNKGQKMKNILNAIKQELNAMNNDIDFVKTMSVYGYIIFSCVAMLVGLVIGSNS